MRLAPEVGRHVRRRGEDVGLGDIVLTAGQVLTPGRLALAAAANVPVVHCIPRPRVAVVSTGDELVRVGEHPAYGQIVDSNSAMLAALVEAAGAEVASVTHVPDDADRLRDVSFHVFVWPVLRRLAGAPVVAALEDSPEVIETVAAQGWESAADKVELTRVMLGPEGAHPSRGQGSHMLGALGQADALAIVPAEITRVEAGTRVRCLPLLGHA
jgi:molybdopterin biosynthesis enzyme